MTVIFVAHRQGFSCRSIARQLGRSPSTISRELRRVDSAAYCPSRAAAQYRQNRMNCVRRHRLVDGEPLFRKVQDMLRFRQWSPQQISQRLKAEHPDDPSWHVSHETIYAAIYAYPRNQLKKVFIEALRQHKPKRGVRRTAPAGGPVHVPEEQTIHHRPEAINERLIPGHWEGDLIVGKLNRSSVGTVVERQTGFVVLCKMDSKRAEDVRIGFERQMKKLCAFLRLSMTYDRGSEMAQHPLMSKHLNMQIYFADPHSPWQRGSNENINGLIRQYLPKGADLSDVSQEKLNDIAWLLNTRPRKRHNWRTPQELIDDITANHFNPVALDS
ncbi:IS30 family transposase [Gammaproteobacteria bacterium]|nr:IS30 family transposase [Gammaproteobacteria bacterium]